MPELPEVQTTVDGLNRYTKGRRIISVTTTYDSKFYKGRDEIKNPEFFKKIGEEVQKRVKSGQSEMAATMVVMREHQAELQKIMKN